MFKFIPYKKANKWWNPETFKNRTDFWIALVAVQQ